MPKKKALYTPVDYVNEERYHQGEISMEELKELQKSNLQIAAERKKAKAKASSQKRKGKRTKHSTPSHTSLKDTSDHDKVFDEVFSFKNRRRENHSIATYLDRMEAYAFREEDQQQGIRPGWSVRHFCLENGWTLDSFQEMVSRHEILKELYEVMKSMLGERRDWGATTRMYDAGHVGKTLGHYHPVFVEERKRLLEEQVLAKARAESITNEEMKITVVQHVKKE